MDEQAMIQFEKMLADGKDSVMLRYSLGNGYLNLGDTKKAAAHLAKAVEMDPLYSAAWKVYGKALVEIGHLDCAMQAYRTGIDVAEKRGDRQAAKEMRVFLRRLEKAMS